MQLSFIPDSLGHLSFEEMVSTVSLLGVRALELTTGNWSEAPHIDLDGLLMHREKRDYMVGYLIDHDIRICALNCSGNILDPTQEGRHHEEVVLKTFKLAELLEVDKIIMMSGLPAGGPKDTIPNWITTSWPPSTQDILHWQWNEVAIPYWKELVKKAEDRGIKKIALENHGYQLVYNPETLFRLREHVGELIGMNLDPSHMFWMGGDPIQSVRALGDALYHVHAKDARIEGGVSDRNGLLDTKTIDRYSERSWNYAAIGYGHSEQWWREFFTVVSMVGYDGEVSLEMEDMSMNPLLGVEKSIDVLKRTMPCVFS